ncbi:MULTISPECIES: peptidoglycan-binding protein [Bacillus]|uniref:peptidoglycan-binding protein n=1 Tax=Bacillus TaxID=1386 RepID=UPI00046AFDDE|nr:MULTISPECIES: peptidoglycan-binding protein [Bacillus]MED1412510.1 peptidoglycan-binding protein [Bacillus paramycoides]MED1463826.1 peptidoglycan-binding protein [Bacillus paramycoides]MED1495423.1 peptidoglycan-binding protein [Bacillus paramycoides]
MYNSHPYFSGSSKPPNSIARVSDEGQEAFYRQPSGKIFAKIYEKDTERPIKGVKVSIYKMTNDGRILASRQSDGIILYTNEFGETDTVALPTPPKENATDPLGSKPYSEYAISIEAAGYAPVVLRGTQIFEDVTAIQKMELIPISGAEGRDSVEIIDIPEHTLIGQYPQQESQQEQQKELEAQQETREDSDKDIVIPEFIIVHDGHPNAPARNYKMRFKDYIKNVLASEVYPTWKKEALLANALCIMTFTLNRIYVNPYKGKGFTITSSTQFDQQYTHGRNTFEHTDDAVDEVFKQYLAKHGENTPFFTQYRDGKKQTCLFAKRPGMLYQWGTFCLAEKGMNYLDILKYYYKDIEIRLAEFIQVIKSFPGKNLKEGDQNTAVETIQKYLFHIRIRYTDIPEVRVNGTFNSSTANAVKAFQRQFQIPENGVVDEVTWNKMNDIYVYVTNLPGIYPILQNGSQGEIVRKLQNLLKDYGFYEGQLDGFFGLGTETSVKEFQKIKSFTVTGVVRKELWIILEAIQYTMGTSRTSLTSNSIPQHTNTGLNINTKAPSQNQNQNPLSIYPSSMTNMTNSSVYQQTQSFYNNNRYYPFS